MRMLSNHEFQSWVHGQLEAKEWEIEQLEGRLETLENQVKIIDAFLKEKFFKYCKEKST